LALLRKQTATVSPQTYTDLRPRVLSYATAVGIGDESGANIMRLVLQTLISLLLVVVALNVAVLVYARTAAHTGEIAMRTALARAAPGSRRTMRYRTLRDRSGAGAGLGCQAGPNRPTSENDAVPTMFARHCSS
jgi:hypothetical protein